MTPEQIEQSAQYIVMQYYRDSVQVQEIVALVRAAVEEEQDTCVKKILEFSNDVSERLRPHSQANELRYSLDHMFVALSLYVKGEIDINSTPATPPDTPRS